MYITCAHRLRQNYVYIVIGLYLLGAHARGAKTRAYTF